MYPQSFTLSLMLLLLLLLLCSLNPSYGQQAANASTKYFEVTHTLPTDYQVPTCSLIALQLVVGDNSTATTNGTDPWAVAGNYSPPAGCPAPWSAIVAELSADISHGQEKRIVGVWIGGVEILRSSTVEAVGYGAYWMVRKDVSRYASVLSQSNVTSALVARDAVKGTVNETYPANFTGSFQVNVTFYYYGGVGSSVESGLEGRKFGSGGLDFSENERKLGSFGDSLTWVTGGLSENMIEKDGEEVGGVEFQSEEKTQMIKSGNLIKLPSEGSDGNGDNRLQYQQFYYQTPADLIIPISKGGNSTGSWFVIHNGSDLHSKEIKIPKNTYKAVLEIYVSSHAGEEFWYSNPPNTLLQRNNNLTAVPVKSAFRQVFAAIDGLYVGSFVPIPIVYSGGISPLFWDPVVAIGAFNLPSSDLDLTPFLGLLLADESHTFTLGITEASSFWLVDANLHLWLDPYSAQVTAGLSTYSAPEIKINIENKFGDSESEFKIQAERKLKFVGWVISSKGNLTTNINHELEYENEMKIKPGSGFKQVQLKSKTKTKTEVKKLEKLLLTRVTYETDYPLELKIERERKGDYAISKRVQFSHRKIEKGKVASPSGDFSMNLENNQESEERTLVQGGGVVSRAANTEQKYKFRDQSGCYIRQVVAGEGFLMEDNVSNQCLQ